MVASFQPSAPKKASLAYLDFDLLVEPFNLGILLLSLLPAFLELINLIQLGNNMKNPDLIKLLLFHLQLFENLSNFDLHWSLLLLR